MIALALLFNTELRAESPVSYTYAERGAQSLKLDVYQPKGESKNTCVIYVFGGGFIMGARDEEKNVWFYKDLAARGYTVVAIDYRLGLQGVNKVSPLNPKPVFQAVDVATEDLIAATRFVIDHKDELKIDPSRIALIGSSAGAITALQADYELSNSRAVASCLPQGFRYGAVVAMAGSVFSREGRPTYVNRPAPTMFLHGTKDKVVVYKKIQLFSIGMFGTDALVKIFEKERFPYMAIRYVGNHHDVAEFPRQYNQDQICDFIDTAIQGKYTNRLDILVKDRYAFDKYNYELTRKDLYNGN